MKVGTRAQKSEHPRVALWFRESRLRREKSEQRVSKLVRVSNCARCANLAGEVEYLRKAALRQHFGRHCPSRYPRHAVKFSYSKHSLRSRCATSADFPKWSPALRSSEQQNQSRLSHPTVVPHPGCRSRGKIVDASAGKRRLIRPRGGRLRREKSEQQVSKLVHASCCARCANFFLFFVDPSADR